VSNGFGQDCRNFWDFLSPWPSTRTGPFFPFWKVHRLSLLPKFRSYVLTLLLKRSVDGQDFFFFFVPLPFFFLFRLFLSPPCIFERLFHRQGRPVSFLSVERRPLWSSATLLFPADTVLHGSAHLGAPSSPFNTTARAGISAPLTSAEATLFPLPFLLNVRLFPRLISPFPD